MQREWREHQRAPNHNAWTDVQSSKVERSVVDGLTFVIDGLIDFVGIEVDHPVRR